jgi:hypothetical protein
MSCRFAVMSLCVVVLLAGCRRDLVPGPDAPAINEERFAELREFYATMDPPAQLGIVTDVLPEHRLAAVGQIDLGPFREGQAISFMDSNERLIAHGYIERITSRELHVRYEAPGREEREPRVGDMAIRFLR